MSEYNPIDFWNIRAIVEPELEAPGVLQANLATWIRKWGRPDDVFLDVGPGTGRIYIYLNRRGLVDPHNYAACDIASEYARLYQRRTGLYCQVWDGQSIPCRPAMFSWVLLFSVLLHVPPDDIARVLAECARVSSRYVFVSTYTGTAQGLEPYCFAHDCPPLFKRAGLRVLEFADFPEEQQGQWVLERE